MPQVTFRSDQFSSTPAPGAINDMLGKDLAEWLQDELKAAGFETGEVIAEDYGYGFWIERHRSHYWITHTQLEPSENELPPLWSVGIDYDPGCLWIWRLRARPQADDQTAIALAVHDILKANPHISDIQWQGRDGTVTAEPRL
jgi:hypothetical protein